MHILALHFSNKDTWRLEKVSGALIAITGAALFIGALTPVARRSGQLLGGFALAAAGVLFVLAVRFGTSP